MFTFICFWISLTLALPNSFGWESSNHSADELIYPPPSMEAVPLELDQDHPFWFGETGTFAFQSFYATSSIPTAILIVDAFCSGDSFLLFDNGYQVATCFNMVPNDECVNYSLDLDVNVSNTNFCAFAYPLEAYYFHNLTIQVTRSPYGYGQAYIRYVID